MLYLVEHFYSIQGEGKFIGSPSLFLRFGGCNMKCEGFGCSETMQDSVVLKGCDTIYAVNREYFSKSWQTITQVEELLEILESYTFPRAVDIVFTGGEPLVNASDPIFVEFLKEIDKRGHQIHFETNGSLDIDFKRFPIYKKAIYALSVKLENSAEKKEKRINQTVLQNIIENSKESYFKFSIDAKSIKEKEIQEIDSIVSLFPKTQVFCMPLGSTKEEIEDASEPLVEFCKMKGYNYGDRLHIRIWNTKKGI